MGIHDPAGAVDRLSDLLRRYPRSPLRYRALQEIAWQSLKRHPSPTAEDRSQACSALALLRQDPPDPAGRGFGPAMTAWAIERATKSPTGKTAEKRD